MRDELRWILGLSISAALLIAGCAIGPENGRSDPRSRVASADTIETSGKAIAYFLASPEREARPATDVSSTYRTLSGSTLAVWREAKASRLIAFEDIRGLRIREERPTPALTPTFSPTSSASSANYVVAEVEVRGAKADHFLSLSEEEGDAFFWVASDQGEAIDFLPIAFALRPSEGLRPSENEETNGLWVSAGRFRSRVAAEAFFESLGDVPRRFIALSDSERAMALAENERLVDQAIWESVCDPAALAEVEGQLEVLLQRLPDYAERASAVDCRSQKGSER